MTDVGNEIITVRSQISNDESPQYSILEDENVGITADAIIESWDENRNDLHQALINSDLSHLDDVVGDDSNCKNYMGKGTKPLSNRFKCDGCTHTGILFLNQRINSDIITIQVGKYVGQQYRLKSNLEGKLASYVSTTNPVEQSKVILDRLKYIKDCESTLENMVQTTKFNVVHNPNTQYIAMSILMEAELNKFQIPCTPIFSNVVSCGNRTHIIDRIPNLGIGTFEHLKMYKNYYDKPSPQSRANPSDPFTYESAKGILVQLTSTLHALSYYSFIHGKACLEYLGFDSTPCDYNYDGVSISSPFTLRLIPSLYASMTYQANDGLNYRIYYSPDVGSKTVNLDALQKISIVPQLKPECDNDHKLRFDVGCAPNVDASNPHLEEYTKIKLVTYSIQASESEFIYYRQNMGIPLFYSSFDLYCFMISLMLESSFYDAIHRNPQLMAIWKGLWQHGHPIISKDVNGILKYTPSDYERVTEALHTLRSRGLHLSYAEICTLLSTYGLRCDAVAYVWEQCRSLH
jgi:hypothetical protein